MRSCPQTRPCTAGLQHVWSARKVQQPKNRLLKMPTIFCTSLNVHLAEPNKRKHSLKLKTRRAC